MVEHPADGMRVFVRVEALTACLCCDGYNRICGDGDGGGERVLEVWVLSSLREWEDYFANILQRVVKERGEVALRCLNCILSGELERVLIQMMKKTILGYASMHLMGST